MSVYSTPALRLGTPPASPRDDGFTVRLRTQGTPPGLYIKLVSHDVDSLCPSHRPYFFFEVLDDRPPDYRCSCTSFELDVSIFSVDSILGVGHVTVCVLTP